MTVLFLYTELADYFIKCCEELTGSARIHIVRWPVNKEAPFNFNFPDKIKIYDKNHYKRQALKHLVEKIKPDLLVCSGWIDKDYLHIARTYFNKIPTVLTLDTHWKGSLKQWVAIALSPLFIRNTFSHAWVPGNIQALYAKKLGFRPTQIKQGFYCCDLNKFNTIFKNNLAIKQSHFPKRFLFVGRYYEFKGIRDLWEAFVQLQNETPCDWELWCLGAGDIEPVIHPKIRHFGFVQPADLDPILRECGVFVLPSRFEPWGVVVQEYAASGFPLLLSEAVGATEAFLEAGKNGFTLEPGNIPSIKIHLKKIVDLSSKELFLMSEKSHELAQKINPADWANTVKEIYYGFKQN